MWQGEHFQWGSQGKKTSWLLSEDVKEVRTPALAFQDRSEPATFKDQQGGPLAGAESQMERELGDESEKPVTPPHRSQWLLYEREGNVMKFSY